MSRKRISVPLSHDGINNLIKEIEIYRKDVEDKFGQLLKELAELGRDTADETYRSTHISFFIEEFDGGKRISISAQGEMICFLEFGAGTMTDFAHPFASEVPFEVYPGSWSVKHSMQFSTKGYWYFGGKKYMYSEPRRGMYEASKRIQEDVLKVARKVFG